jgi:hypothetical protein
LDGLVAKRADVDPNAKRYQTETEAIELPDDEIEMKRLETDPDVSTRCCSICGYQGKWVSEMIRHKRVHTNERPFKCKFCNRTSKWKADLIRHVAKTHGIRVVSKYSRSKAFDVQHELKEEQPDRPIKEEHQRQPKSSISLSSSLSSLIKENSSLSSSCSSSSASSFTSSQPAFKCLMCFFEQDSIDQLIAHLHSVHQISPFECLQCKRTFDEASAASEHCNAATCTPLSIKINFSPVCLQKPSHSLSSSATTSSPCSIRSESRSLSTDDEEISSASASLACSECPFRTESDEKLIIHKIGHEIPKGLLNYKCAFCNWYSKKKSSIERHMALHTSRPEEFMNQVERNLITPAMLLQQPKLSPKIRNNTFGSNFGGASIGSLNLPSTPLSAPIFGSSFPFFGHQQQQQQISTLSPIDLASATSLLSAAGLYSPLTATPTTPQFPDLSALHSSLSSNPLLAFGLCSLLDMQKSNLFKFQHVA